jgi:hypothetical protein
MEQQIPDQIKQFARSPQLYDVVEKIGTKYSLHIDQIGGLNAEIYDILFGVNKSSDFTEHIIKRLEIDRYVAIQIIEDVNKEIFQKLKIVLQAQNNSDSTEQVNNQSISDIERLGNFNIEKPIDSMDHGIEHIESKDEVIGVIESPTAEMARTDTMLIDHLLAGPVVSVEKKTVVNAPEEGTISNIAKPTVAPTGNKGGSDLYREPIN